MEQLQWEIAKKIEDLTIEHGEDLTELVKVGMELIKDKEGKDEI